MEDVVILYADSEAVEWFSSTACWSVIVAAKAIPIKFVQFIFHFVIIWHWIVHTGCLQYWLGYACKCEASARRSTCYCFLTRTKQPHTSPTICSNPCPTAMFKIRSQAVRMVNNGTSTVDGDTEQLFWASGPCITCVPMHAQKVFNFEFDFIKM